MGIPRDAAKVCSRINKSLELDILHYCIVVTPCFWCSPYAFQKKTICALKCCNMACSHCGHLQSCSSYHGWCKYAAWCPSSGALFTLQNL